MEEGSDCTDGEVGEEDKIERMENELENWQLLSWSSYWKQSATGACVEEGFEIAEVESIAVAKEESIFAVLFLCFQDGKQNEDYFLFTALAFNCFQDDICCLS